MKTDRRAGFHEDAVAWNVGRYTVHGEIAAGGMATVHIGRMAGDAGFSKLVAIKRLHAQFAKDPDFVAMFVDEARLATRIRHPNVVQPLDVITERGEVLIVMEYIHGEALSRIGRTLRATGERIPLRITIAMMTQALHGLHAAHEARSERGEPLGIVHRDISPQNIIVGVDGSARVLDFGIAKAADQVHATRQGELKGKLVYMAPEQLMGEPVTRQTDIFSAAVVLWECLTGQRLFDSDSQSPLLARAKHHKVDPPSEFSLDVTPEIDNVVLKGLALAPEDRWRTARDMALALEELVPPATQAQVGSWVEVVAEKSLLERQERIQEIESSAAGPSTRDLAEDIGSDRLFTKDIVESKAPPKLPKAASDTAVDRGPPDPISDVHRKTPLPPRRSIPSPTQDPYFVPAGDPLGDNVPATSLTPPSVPTEHAKPATIRVESMPRKGRASTVALVAVLLLLLGFIFGAPYLVRKNFIEGMQRQGIEATIDDVDLRSLYSAAHLTGVTLRSGEFPSVTINIKAVDVEMDRGLSPVRIIAHDPEVKIDGSYASLAQAYDDWAQKHAPTDIANFPATVNEVRVESGRVVWNMPSGVGTRIEANSILFDTKRVQNRPLGQDYGLQPALVTLTLPTGKVGPWLLDSSHDDKGKRFHISFNQANPQAASADLSMTNDVTSFVVRATRAKVEDFAMDPKVIGGASGDPIKIDVAIDGTIKFDKLDARAKVGIEALRPPDASPAGFSVEGKIAGILHGPHEITAGLLMIGLAPAPLTGTVTVFEDGFSIAVQSKVGIKCDTGGYAGQVDAKVDTRDFGQATLTITPKGCRSR